MTTLGALFSGKSLPQVVLAEKCGVSKRTVNALLRYGYQPKQHPRILAAKLFDLLAEHGVEWSEYTAAYEETTGSRLDESDRPDINKEDIVILKRVSLTPQARKAFGIFRDPFDEPDKPEAIYLSPEARYVRAALWDAAVNGNFLAVVGESGSGKTTLKRELKARLAHDATEVKLIEPYVLTMALSDNGAGKPLRATHINEAIISTIQPSLKTNGSPEIMARRVHQALRESAMAGNKHVLLIEEAHDLHAQTLKALKRYWELEDAKSMRRLLSIILIGQTELSERLNNTTADVREVVQRCDVVYLPPLPEVGEFLRFRLRAVDMDADALFTPQAMEAMRDRLTVSRDKSGRAVSMVYPLAVGNLAAACLNHAAAHGARQVDDDVVRTVRII